ncbi:MAG: hypothetical protein LBF62_08255 [Tannerellaceae bacterium]|jgi:hypothetical protein|nr:hypothetical protein [Tannerellaceae bacterium]
MKKHFVFFVALLIGAVAVSCTVQEKGEDGSSVTIEQQREVIKAQGHPHELLTKLHAEGEWNYPQATLTGTCTDSVSFDGLIFADISTGTTDRDTAVLIVKWTDGKRTATNDSILAWGFVFNRPDTITSERMLREVAAIDNRLSVLLLNSGVSFVTGDTLNYAVGGFGYNYGDKSRVPLLYNLAGVEKDPNINFTFDPDAKFPTPYGQTSAPKDPQGDINAAISASQATGIIEHPFNYDVYGYACYDFDWWTLESDEDEYSWQSGWYNGYWAFYVKDALIAPFDYSGVGASQRILQNHSVDGWVYSSWTEDMHGGYVPAPVQH